jgi:DNA-binding MarR family transcriptional regulator
MEKKFEGVWIPLAVIQLDIGLLEKIILSEIHAFATSKSTFYKTNAQIADDWNTSVTKVTRAVKTLCEEGYIERGSFDGRRRHLTPTGQIDYTAKAKRPTSMVKTTKQSGKKDQAGRSKSRGHIKEQRKDKKSTIKKSEVVEQVWIEIKDYWLEWKRYKKAEHGFKFKTEQSELTALKNLQTISNNDDNTARTIIGTSIANGWKGLFAPKPNAVANQPSESDRDLFAKYVTTGRL